MKQIHIAILGFGTVGKGVYHILTEGKKNIEHKEHLSVSVKQILVRRTDDPRFAEYPNELLTSDLQTILDDPDISVVVECMGGTDPAKDYITRVLKAGKTIVTSNKEVVSKHWPELEKAAKSTGAGLYIEATVGGGVPIIRALLDSMQANDVHRLMGIINGTTNYILTKMTHEGLDYADVLKEAQALGYAEANPAADVEGWDCVYKLSILASIAFHAKVNIDAVHREGITKVSAEDIAWAKKMGHTIKLLAIGKKIDGHLEVRVHPTMLPDSHILANVNDAFNGIFLTGDSVGDLMLYGRGAGMLPTASAVVSDVIYAAKQEQHAYMTFANEDDAPQWLIHQKDWLSGFYIRMTVCHKAGTLAEITRVLGEENVSVSSVMQNDVMDANGNVQLVFITDESRELAVQSALARLAVLPCVDHIDSVMRVEK